MDTLTELIIESPKVDFFIKLASEADMFTAFADFYKQDYVTVVDVEAIDELHGATPNSPSRIFS